MHTSLNTVKMLQSLNKNLDAAANAVVNAQVEVSDALQGYCIGLKEHPNPTVELRRRFGRAVVFALSEGISIQTLTEAQTPQQVIIALGLMVLAIPAGISGVSGKTFDQMGKSGKA